MGRPALGIPSPSPGGGTKVNPPRPTEACVFRFAGVAGEGAGTEGRYEVGGLDGMAICSNVDTLVDWGIGE